MYHLIEQHRSHLYTVQKKTGVKRPKLPKEARISRSIRRQFPRGLSAPIRLPAIPTKIANGERLALFFKTHVRGTSSGTIFCITGARISGCGASCRDGWLNFDQMLTGCSHFEQAHHVVKTPIGPERH